MPQPIRRTPASSAHLSLILLTLAVAALAAGAPRPAAAAPLGSLDLPAARAAVAGQMVKMPDLAGDVEVVRFAGELIPTLLRLDADRPVRIADWPVAPGIRRDVRIARHELYAPGARVLQVDAAGTHELPHSRLVFLWGTVVDEPQSGISVAVDPDTGTLSSVTQTAGVQYELHSLVAGKAGPHLVATAAAFEARGTSGHRTNWTCGEENLVPLPPAAPPGRDTVPQALQQAAAVTNGSGFDLATVALDTDHEFLSIKFANDTTAATDYIASMFATINVMYERDLQVQLLIGTTILRTSAANDPYVQTSSTGAASANQLSEFSNYWSANYGSVTRTVAAMLSGKSSSPYEASGIAWVAGLCSTSYGYSFSQLFTFAADSSSLPGDTLILGHEIGHNFGTRHTHCYTPPIDECYNLESGCYSGPTSCPAPSTVQGVTNVLGTVMSYCHLLGGCTSAEVFHPRVIAVINPNIQSALGVCIATGTGPAPTVTFIQPDHGPTAGGTPVTITGTNFASGDLVTIGGAAATGVSVVSSTTITALTGAHATGTVDVVVSSGGSPATLGSSFFYTQNAPVARFYTLSPCRLVDTRNAAGPYGGPALATAQRRTFQAAGQCGIPTSAKTISANITVVSPAAAGSFSLYPGNGLPLGTSSLNFNAGDVRAGATLIQLATDGTGTFGLSNNATGTSQVVVDVNGYFQ
jgi:hypothetical protein